MYIQESLGWIPKLMQTITHRRRDSGLSYEEAGSQAPLFPELDTPDIRKALGTRNVTWTGRVRISDEPDEYIHTSIPPLFLHLFLPLPYDTSNKPPEGDDVYEIRPLGRDIPTWRHAIVVLVAID